MKNLQKKLNGKLIGNLKFAIIALLFVCATVYAFYAMRGFVYNSEYSRTLSFQYLKLDNTKEYLFVREYKTAPSPNTVIIPMGRANMPDSLCTLYFDGEWKLKLTNKLRRSHKDNTKATILYPFCRTNVKQNDYKESDFFHNSTKTPMQADLLTGVRFNNGTGKDPFVIKIGEQNGEYYFLSKGVAFFSNQNVPVSNKKRNVVELDFTISGDTLSSKYTFALPFFGTQELPERKYIIIENNAINYNDNVQPIDKDSFTFSVNDCVFLLKNNYNATTKYFVLPILFIIIVLFGCFMLKQLYKLTNKTVHPNQRNLIKTEQYNILSLRILFNTIIFLGFPILLLKTQEDPSRLYQIAILAIILNINWVNAIKWFVVKIRSNSKTFSIISLLCVLIATYFSVFHSNDELVWRIPILKIVAIIFIFLPFAIDCFPQLLEIGLIKRVRKWIIKKEIHNSRDERDRSGNEFIFHFACYSILVVLVLLISIFSKDLSTLIFTLLSLFIILIINYKRFKILSFKEWGLVAIVFISLGWIMFNIAMKPEKKYRVESIRFFPDHERFNEFPDIESSRETIAGQIFILNAVENFKPSYKMIVLPECKSVFFSDYSIMWSFKIGGWLWFWLYFGVLTMLGYTIISLLIIFSKPIKLKTGKKGFYNKRIVFSLNLLLAITLVQYVYTLLGNFWSAPLTGQSAGLQSPTIFEYLFHILLINYLYIYMVTSVRDRQNEIQQDSATNNKLSSYIPTKLKSMALPVVVFAGCILLLFYQRNRIDNYIQKNNNRISWQMVHEGDLDSLIQLSKDYKDTLIVLAYNSFEKMYKNTAEQNNFRNYLLAFYGSDYVKKRHYIDKDYINNNTNMDSIMSIKSRILLSETDVRSYPKYVNGKPALFINNEYSSGCPPHSATIDFQLQGELNKALERWAATIDRKKNYKMISGSVIVAHNATGNILASASYPFLYNQNLYSLSYADKQLNDSLLKYNVGAIAESILIKQDHLEYINFSEFDMFQGSLVKPIFAYCALALEIPITQEYLSNWLGSSSNIKSLEILKKIRAAGKIDSINIVSKQAFGFHLFPNLTQKLAEKLSDKVFTSFAIGQQDKLIFKKVVRAYMRIRVGKKMDLSYEQKDPTVELLPLNDEQLKKLRTAMCALRKGTATKAGKALKEKGVDINSYMAKTGTAEIYERANCNRTSSIIVVGEQTTVAIQLYGILPNNNAERSAQHLFIKLINSNLINLK
jgi:hypothetical protein